MKILTILIVALNLFGLTPKQIETLKYVYNKTKQYNLGYTMSAICLAESNAGVYKLTINKNSIDAGLFMINSQTLSNDRWKAARIVERLIEDRDFSISIAVERFKYFYNYYISKGYNKHLAWKYAICRLC
jgi:predicted methyltransferase